LNHQINNARWELIRSAFIEVTEMEEHADDKPLLPKPRSVEEGKREFRFSLSCYFTPICCLLA